MSDIDALVETVREPVIEWGTHLNKYGTREKCLAALDELAGIARKFNAMDSRYHELWHEETDRAEAAEGERDRLKAALRAIKANAISWHGVEEDGSGHVKALKVIAQWCDDALDPTAALADVGGTEENTG